MKQIIEKNSEFFHSGDSDNSAQIEKENDASIKALIIRQASHEIMGSFFGVSSIGPILKLSVGNIEETTMLLDHLIDNCQTYKYKLSNFLDYIRFDAGLHDAFFETVNIRSLLNKVVNENQYSGIERNVKISLFISNDIPELIITDEFRIAQICTNMLSNAVNYSPVGTPVLMEVERQGDKSWAIIVKDRGEGMNTEKLNSIFKLSASERKSLKNPGGLGLFVTRYLVEDVLQGKITLLSQPGDGTICQVILPLNEVDH